MTKKHASVTPKTDALMLRFAEWEKGIPEAVASYGAISEMKCQTCMGSFRYYMHPFAFFRDKPWILCSCACAGKHIWFYVLD